MATYRKDVRTLARVIEDKNLPSRYPWDEWLDGRTWEVVQGEDFVVDKASFRNQVYAVAKTRGVKVRVLSCDVGFHIQAM